MLLFLSVWISFPHPTTFSIPSRSDRPKSRQSFSQAAFFCSMIAARHAGAVLSLAWRLCLRPSRRCCRSCPIVQLPIALSRFNRAMAQTTAEPPARIAGAIRVTRGVPFSKADGVPLSLDVYQPAADGTFPIIMQIYGGSWQSGSPVEPGVVLAALRRARLRRGRDRLPPRSRVEVARADRRRPHGALLDLGGSTDIRRRLEPHRAGRAICRRAARDAARVSGRSLVDTRRRELLRARRSRRRLAPSTAAGSCQRARHPRDVHRRHAGSETRALPPRIADHLGFEGVRADIEHLRLARSHRRSALRPHARRGAEKAGATSVLLELPWSEHSFDAVPNGMGRQIALRYTERFIAWAVGR